MSTPEDRHELFKTYYDLLSFPNQGVLAKWMSQKDTKKTRDHVSRKLAGSGGVTTTDVAFIQMLKIMQVAGYDLSSVEFAEDGEISDLKKRKIKK
ncbi:MAG: hypothetical protein ACJAS1_000853 [Oleiphilaceae bacterium]|jgi:hypothetical protein